MKRIVLALALMFTVSLAEAQCDPDPIYADSVFGVWPDTMTNFPFAQLAVDYLAQIDLIVPESTADVPGIPIAAPIDSGVVLGVSNMPPGLDYQCNSHTDVPCTYLPATQGCAVISGIPTEAGVFDMEISIRAYLLVFGSTVEFDLDFEGYRIVVENPNSIDGFTIEPLIGQNRPNPFDKETTVDFDLVSSGEVLFSVVNMLGEEVYSESIEGQSGRNSYTYSPDELQEGIYLYSITADGTKVTKRMVYRK